MRILTVRQPWAWAIIHGAKNVENRVRNIAGDYRGPVAIHAGLAYDHGSHLNSKLLREAQDRAAIASGADVFSGGYTWEIGAPDPRAAWSVQGAIIGVVDLTAVHSVDAVGCMAAIPDCSPWAEKTPGMHHLRFENPRALDEPIPYKGALGLRKTEFAIVNDYLVAPWGHGPGSCTPYGCEPWCAFEPVARLVTP